MTHIFELPLYITVGVRKPKKISLTLNWYRNAHHHLSNKIKQNYRPISGAAFKANRIKIRYELILSNNKKTDYKNWEAVADKFFLDYLVREGMIPEDDCSVYDGGGWTVSKDTSLNQHKLIAYVSTGKELS